jgi:photosystem II stability/assembly factor-like uncharacterized protein
LEWIKMADARTGWAITAETGRLLRTADGGSTWRDVTPNVEGMIAVSTTFLDGQQIWTLSYDQERSAVPGANSLLFRSADGGQTWESFQTPFQGGLLEFKDPQNGWAFVVPPGSYSTTATALIYQTGDGGQTWSRPPVQDPREAATDPAGGITVFSGDDLAFRSGATLWVRDHARPDVPLWASPDGGQTWRPVRVSASQPPGGRQFTASLPVFPTAADGFFTLSLAAPAGAKAPESSTSIFISHDGGKDWSASPTALRGAASGPPDFLTAQVGFLQVGDALWATADAGLSWQDRSAGLDTGSAKDRPLLGFSFGDARTGWAIVADRLYQTRDGGLSWQAVESTIR